MNQRKNQRKDRRRTISLRTGRLFHVKHLKIIGFLIIKILKSGCLKRTAGRKQRLMHVIRS